MPQLHFARFRDKANYSHYLFRFPAKFHPPVARYLVEQYSSPGDHILDPFCGSGTLLVEAIIAGRQAVGVDIDPLATFIARVKSRPISPKTTKRAFASLQGHLGRIRRSDQEYDRLMHDDLHRESVTRQRTSLSIPAIPNIEHWFRAYVILDLARLRNAIYASANNPAVRDFFLACFAGIVRNSSNADPVPVSGLEVTSYMRRLDEQGRRIDPYTLFERRVTRELRGMEQLWNARKDTRSRVIRGDATRLCARLGSAKFDGIITSPPYNTAVDYYRRHMLEMYWLGLVETDADRQALAPRYIGRDQVRVNNRRLKTEFESEYVNRLISHARRISPKRERAVIHYCASMQKSIAQAARVLKPRKTAVFVVGNAKWNGKRVRATKLLVELASERFSVVETASYPSRNRYMSYERNNGADINREYVVVLRKK